MIRKRLEDQPAVGHAISDVGGGRALVDRLSAAQLSKLALNRHKLHWRDASVPEAYLAERLMEEVLELLSADGPEAWAEAADVANLAAMIAERRRDGAR